MRLFGKRQRDETNETIELLRAVKHIAEALTCDELPSDESRRAVERTIEPPRAWEGLMRPARTKEGSAAPCRS